MILKLKNPKSNPNNMLQITEIDGLCCGDKNCALVKKYKATIDTSTVTSLSGISLGGIEYGFGTSIDTTSASGLAMLEEKINEQIAKAGYAADGVTYTLDGNTLVIQTYYSQISFDFVNSSPTASTAFEVTDAMTIGDMMNCSCCDATAVPALVPPTCFAATTVYAGDGKVIQILADTGKVLAQWTDDATADGTIFNAGGVAAMALDASALNWTFGADGLVICDSTCKVDKLYNLTDEADLATFAPSGSVYLCLKVIACQKIENVKIVCDGNEVYNGSLSPDECANIPNVTIQDCVICLDATALGLTGTKTFTITISTHDCDDVVEELIVNF